MISLVIRSVLVGVPFVWLGAVLAISFLEAPLKFRAPGITIPLGLGIGRIVFRALNVAELTFASFLTAAVALNVAASPPSVQALLTAAWLVLVAQVVGLRPPLDRRAKRLQAGEVPPRSRLHLVYIALEFVKVGVLLALGCLIVSEVSV